MTDDSYRLIDTRLYKEDDIILILVINHINKFIYVSIEFMFHQIIIKKYYKILPHITKCFIFIFILFRVTFRFFKNFPSELFLGCPN